MDETKKQPQQVSETLDWARYYVGKGLSVIPLKVTDKTPAVKTWKEYQNTIASDETLQKWFGDGKHHNIGIITGSISGLAVVDYDSKEALEFRKKKNLLKTPLVKTNKGYHGYYAYPEGGARNFQKRDDLPGIDLRAEGGYVVAPPSVHPSGHKYYWLPTATLEDFELVPLPSIFLTRDVSQKTPIKELYKGASEGTRNDSLTRLIGSWVSDGLTFDECLENALLVNEKNDPPLPENEVRAIIKSIIDTHVRNHPEEVETTVSARDPEEPWPDPIAFDEYDALPAFPIGGLPQWCRNMAEEVAKVNQVDEGLTGGIILGVLATCCAKKAVVDLITHKEPLNLYTTPVSESGERKTATIEILAAPLYEYQDERREALAPIVSEHQAKLHILENKRDKLEKEAARASGDEFDKLLKQAQAAAREVEATPSMSLPTYIVDDITVEQTGILAAENGEKLSIISAEGGIFDIMAGRYSDGFVSIDVYLKGHAGDHWSSDRVGRKKLSMKSPALTLCLAVQPDIVRQIGENRSFRGRGFLARFLYGICTPRAGHRQRQKTEINYSIENTYKKNVLQLMRMSCDAILKLDPDADAMWDGFYNAVEMELRDGGKLRELRDWGSKLPGAVARIAGLLHFATHGGNAVKEPISAVTMEAARAIGAYYLEHALAAFGIMRQDPRVEAAKKILEFILLHAPQTFKGRDVLQYKSAFKTMEDLEPGLVVLRDRGYIRLESQKYKGKGRPESSSYQVNPKIFKINSKDIIYNNYKTPPIDDRTDTFVDFVDDSPTFENEKPEDDFIPEDDDDPSLPNDVQVVGRMRGVK